SLFFGLRSRKNVPRRSLVFLQKGLILPGRCGWLVLAFVPGRHCRHAQHQDHNTRDAVHGCVLRWQNHYGATGKSVQLTNSVGGQFGTGRRSATTGPERRSVTRLRRTLPAQTIPGQLFFVLSLVELAKKGGSVTATFRHTSGDVTRGSNGMPHTY